VRRVVTVVVATVLGLMLLAAFHTSPGVAPRAPARGRSALAPPAGGAPPAGDSNGTISAGTTAPPGTSPAGGATTVPSNAPPTTAAATRTVDGPVESNRYGDVQVEVVVRGHQIVDVEALELPSDRERSRYINSVAGPDLRQEALQAQSANIDVVSGATYTSESYASSLQAALDQAGF